MAYIGQGIKQGTFKVLDTSGNTYNGSNTTFSLGTQVGSAAQLLVSHDGVIQLPGTDYTLATGGTQITFSTAPASGASIFIVEISGAVGGTVTPSDTSVTADKLNSALLTGQTDIGANIADADLFLIDDGAGGTLRKTTASRIKTYTNAGVSSALDDITTGDAASTLATSAGDITIDAQGNDTDIIFKGTDNSSDTTFLTLDGSEGGQLVLGAHGQINFPDSANVSTDANVLDDYQEGTFNLSSSQASNFFTGFFTKIGRMVFFTCAGQVPSSGNSATQTLTGMPFTTKDQAASQEGSDSAAGVISYESNNGKTASFVLRNNSTQANFFQNDNNVATHATYSEDHFILSGMYTTDS
tara:strand:+ start:1104 stop:2171 length:1068 start_codon:yes stop_codon:yes gene_type:complete